MARLLVTLNSGRLAGRWSLWDTPNLAACLFSLATLGTEACDAVGDAFRPQWRERPAKEFRRISSQRHPRECRRLRRLHSFRFDRDTVSELRDGADSRN